MRKYNEDYSPFGFISSGEEQPHPKCVVCDINLANQAMLLNKFKRHLRTKHSHLCEKLNYNFKRLAAGQTHQAKQGTKISTISDKAQEESYDVAEIVTKRMKSQFHG
jgi:hypothetical protein